MCYLFFNQFRVLVKRQFNTKIKAIQTDWDGEFRSLSPIYAQLDIVHRVSCPHTHEQQGKVKCKQHHIVETGLILMAQSSTLAKF